MLRMFKLFAKSSTPSTPAEPIISSPEIDRVMQALTEEFKFSEGDVDIKIRPKVRYYHMGAPEYIDTLHIKILHVPDSFSDADYGRVQGFGVKVAEKIFGKSHKMMVSQSTSNDCVGGVEMASKNLPVVDGATILLTEAPVVGDSTPSVH